MSFTDDIRDAKVRFPEHVRALENLLREHGIHNTSTAWKAFSSPKFREDLPALLHKIMEVEGGKLTLSVTFGIIGAALGGVGIAALGGAVGVPLALVGAFAGLVLGNEADSEGYTSTLIRKIKAFMNG